MPITRGAKNRRYTRQTEKVAVEVQAALPDAEVDVYRYSSVSIRIRVVTDAFAGRSLAQRDEMVWPVLRKLDDRTRADLMLVLLFTQDERDSGLYALNADFDHPTPSRW